MVTELEDAHAHLREAQECLRLCRLGEPGVFGFERPYSENLRQLERQVKSAISWVWDAQERERGVDFQRSVEREKAWISASAYLLWMQESKALRKLAQEERHDP